MFFCFFEFLKKILENSLILTRRNYLATSGIEVNINLPYKEKVIDPVALDLWHQIWSKRSSIWFCFGFNIFYFDLVCKLVFVNSFLCYDGKNYFHKVLLAGSSWYCGIILKDINLEIEIPIIFKKINVLHCEINAFYSRLSPEGHVLFF